MRQSASQTPARLIRVVGLAVLVAALALAVARASSGDPPSHPQSRPARATAAAGASSAAPDMSLALRFLAPGAGASYTFQFADWNTIEAAFGYSTGQLSSGATLGQFTTKLQIASVPSGDAVYDLGEGGKLWKASDVTWDALEAPVSGTQPVSFTGFTAQFALANVGRYLTGCGFKAHAVSGLTVYSAAGSVATACQGPLGVAIPPAANFAVDPGDRLVAMSASAPALAAALANRRAATANSAVLSSLLEVIGADAAIAVGIGPQFCTELANPIVLAGRQATPAIIGDVTHVYTADTPYLGFGFGYLFTDSDVSGQIAFTYSDAQTAAGDLAPREHVLGHAVSFALQAPYSQLIRLEAGRVSGRTLILEVGRPAGRRLDLGAMFDTDDLGFARC